MSLQSLSKFKKIAQDQYQILDAINLTNVSSLLKEGQLLITSHQNLNIDLSQASQSTSVAIALMLQLLEEAKTHQVQLSFSDIPESIQALAKISNVADLI